MTEARDIVIREAATPDLESVAAMLRRLGAHVGANPKVTADDLAAYGPKGRGFTEVLVAEEGGAIIGIALYSIVFSAWRGRPGIYVSDLFVEDSARGTGLGTRLLRAAVERETPRGCAYLKLDVDKKNAGGISFYEKRGFKLDDHDHTMVLERDGMTRL
ncbi:GNAT family N-acetyltransferase [Microvirga flavescens]|uniref:GNAT family N-acetyltransferase n=1 Tax=Microvirga flavescens TaxID=2249811 RepID=UPI0013004E39|nr:GNAT family N-acetyltransferase [Microvirga flavescens]